MKVFFLAMAVLLSPTAIVLGSEEVPWPMPRGGGGQTGVAPYTGLADPWPVPVISAEDISDQTGLELEFALYVDNFILIGKDRTLFVPASLYRDGMSGLARYLVAVDPEGSRVLWTFPVFNEFRFRPAIGPDGTVYAYDAEGNPVGLDPGTGEILWQPACDELLPPEYAAQMCPEGAFPYLADYVGDILVGPRGNLYLYYRSFWTVLGPSPGHRRIGTSAVPEPFSSEFRPAVGENGWLYIVSTWKSKGYSVKALSPDGKERWNTPIGIPLTEESSIDILAGRRRVFVIARRPNGAAEVMALDGAKGRVLWRRTLDAAPSGSSPGVFELLGPPVLDPKGRLYLVVPQEDGYWLEALDTGSRGRTVWSVRVSTYSTAARDDPTPLLLTADGRLYVGREEGLIILDARTGEPSGCPVPVRVFGIAMDKDAAYFLGHAGGEELLMVTVPNRAPRIVSLSVEPESYGGVPQRVSARISYVIEDPLGWNRWVSLHVDYGDGESFNDDLRPRKEDGTYRLKGTLAHSYAPGDTYDVTLSVNVAGCPDFSASAEGDLCLEPPEIERVWADPVCVHPNGRPVRFLCDASPPEALRGSELVYRWDFGDGAVATGKAVEHVFAEPGEYEVKVMVEVAGHAVPIPAEGTVPVSVRSPEITVDARHLSPELFRFSCQVDDPCGITPERVRWEFGDGESHETPFGDNPAHKYQGEGDYTGSVTVVMGDGAEFAREFRLHAGPPGLVLQAYPRVISPGETVSLVARVTGWAPGDFAYHLWDFGDGVSEEGRGLVPEVSHTYRKAGVYTVTLKLGDSENNVYTRTAVVKVRSPLSPRFTHAPAEVHVGDVVTLDGSASTSEMGEIVSYEWLIANEELGYWKGLSGKTVEWEPPCWGGTYTVRLTVRDRHGNEGSVTGGITVELPPDRACAGDILYHPSAYADEGASEEAERAILEKLLKLFAGGRVPDFDVLSSVTGHVGIVACDGTVIEAVGSGVRRIASVDDFVRRYRHSNVATVIALRVVGASPLVRKRAVGFAEGKIGQPYDLDSILKGEKQIFAEGYYCSELVWAAYQVASGAHLDAEGHEVRGSIDLDGRDPSVELLGTSLRLGFVMPDEIYYNVETQVIWRRKASGG